MNDYQESSCGKIGLGGRVVSYSIMIFFTVMTILPLVWLAYSSFKSNAEIINSPLALPETWTVNNYVRSWKLVHLGSGLFNTVIYTGVATIVTTVLSISTGYAFAKLKFKITSFFNWFIIAGLLISIQAVIVPLYIMWTKVGLYDTRMGIILPYIAFGLPMGIYLATTFIKGIPDSLIEAAIIDGANYFTVFRRLVLPLSRPVVTTIAIFTFLGCWNEFLFAFMLVSSDSLYSLPVGINAFAGTRVSNYGLQFAALVVGVFPTVLFYVFFHRQIMVGFAEGALKD